jgi:hypothetical protein
MDVRPFIFLCAFSYLLQLVYLPSDKINIARPVVKKTTAHFPPNLAHIVAIASGGICLLWKLSHEWNWWAAGVTPNTPGFISPVE